MEEIEVEAETIREAIKIALQKLGVPRGKVNVKILSEENKGLFGMRGASLAKVKVSLKKQKQQNS